ncbi:flagellar assembly protein FliW [Paenibacillus sp. MBLB2552]|uniref:Flagellar assembly factor FliW n=1 Tax=Paenibacillus mellifer TaxID=2937794 RepID=A0A9X1Y880_9BACL|nr:flagellar assembly protein FliW [Paenibacillus mellifer]MCK8489052.1 flagellar assembly protein FliW [Paenibacillus mellifer]
MINHSDNEIVVNTGVFFTFKRGIPGFEEYTKFSIQQHDEHFSFLQSIENENLAFIIVNPFLFFKEYEFELSAIDLEELKITDQTEVAIRSIVTWGKELSQVTANLLAPLVFNVKEHIGKQIVLNKTEYTSKHSLLPNNKTTGGGASC